MFVSICLGFSNIGAYSNMFVDREWKDNIRLGFDFMYRKRNYVEREREKFYFYDILYMRVV